MAKYVSAEQVLDFPLRRDRCDKEHANPHFINGVESVVEYVENLPGADVAPVVHGRWDYCKAGNFHFCSACHSPGKKTEYCPYCGAKMDLK